MCLDTVYSRDTRAARRRPHISCVAASYVALASRDCFSNYEDEYETTVINSILMRRLREKVQRYHSLFSIQFAEI